MRDWSSEWMAAQSNSSNVVTLTHGRNQYPSGGMTVLFSTSNPPTIVYDVSSSNFCLNHNQFNSAIHTGTVEYTLTEVKIPLWDGGFVGRHWDGSTWHTYKSGFLKFILHFGN